MSVTQLNSHEARVLGVLIEKELTTPEQYPLSLNALTSGCNQKSNRDPVSDYTEAEVVVALQGLTAKHLAGRSVPAGSRVERFRHSAREALQVDARGAAVLAELLLRGPQQPGELRARASRMAPLATASDLAEVLDALAARGLVRNLGRMPGERAERWGQLLAPSARAQAPAPDTLPGAVPASASASAPALASAPASGLTQRVADLEARLAAVERKLVDLGA